MSAITSTAAGNWSATGTWAGGVVPVDGDTVTVTHNITDDLGGTVGSDPNTGGTPAITITAGAGNAVTLTLAVGVTRRCKGGISQTGNPSSPYERATINVSHGASLIFDPKSGQQHTHNFVDGSEINFNGTSGSHCVFTTDLTRSGLATIVTSGASNLISPAGTMDGGLVTAAYTDFSNFGVNGANTLGLVTYQGQPNVSRNYPISITNCTFNACSYWWLAESSALWNGDFTMDSCIWSNTTTFSGLGVPIAQAVSTYLSPDLTGTMSFTNNSFDKTFLADYSSRITYRSNVFAGGVRGNGTPSWLLFKDNLVNQDNLTIGVYADVVDCYVTTQSAAGNCFHAFNAGRTFRGCIFQQTDGSFSGGASFIAPRVAGTVAALNCLVLPVVGTPHSSGTLINQQYDNNFTITMDHCLVWGASSVGGGIKLSNGTIAVAGIVTSCRANILYSPAGAGDVYLLTENSGSGTFVTDACTVADYNGMRNPESGACKYNSGAGGPTNVPGYISLQVSSASALPNASLGLHDFTADPQFFDATRDVITWANVVHGQSATWAAAIAYLQANPSMVKAMCDWVKAGFVPTNKTYLHATYPGDTATTDALGRSLNGTVGPLGIQVPGAALLMGA